MILSLVKLTQHSNFWGFRLDTLEKVKWMGVRVGQVAQYTKMKNKIDLRQQKGKKENLLRRLKVGHKTYGQETNTITIYIFPKHLHIELQVPIKPKYLLVKGQQSIGSGTSKLLRIWKMAALWIPVPFILLCDIHLKWKQFSLFHKCGDHIASDHVKKYENSFSVQSPEFGKQSMRVHLKWKFSKWQLAPQGQTTARRERCRTVDQENKY